MMVSRITDDKKHHVLLLRGRIIGHLEKRQNFISGLELMQ